MGRIKEVRDLPLESLVIGKVQVRTREVGRDIAELAASIRKVGLLEPIVVSPSAEKPGFYEIITGQRRFLAHKELKAPTIMAAILDDSVDETEAKIISLTENLMRRDLNNRDLIDVCSALFNKYGTIKAVAEETGLPPDKIKDFVKYPRLIPELRSIVDSGDVRLKDAIRAQDAAQSTGLSEPETLVKLAREMTTMSGAQQDRFVKEARENPERPIEDVLEEQKTSKKIVQIVVTLSTTYQQQLQAFAKAEGASQDDAARSLIEEGLDQKGFSEGAR